MELRHLRCLLAVAKELHFARAAEKLHIEQSPLSRAIKELEEDLGVQRFVRTTRSTRLPRAGKLFVEHVPGNEAGNRQPVGRRQQAAGRDRHRVWPENLATRRRLPDGSANAARSDIADAAACQDYGTL